MSSSSPLSPTDALLFYSRLIKELEVLGKRKIEIESELSRLSSSFPFLSLIHIPPPTHIPAHSIFLPEEPSPSRLLQDHEAPTVQAPEVQKSGKKTKSAKKREKKKGKEQEKKTEEVRTGIEQIQTEEKRKEEMSEEERNEKYDKESRTTVENRLRGAGIGPQFQAEPHHFASPTEGSSKKRRISEDSMEMAPSERMGLAHVDGETRKDLTGGFVPTKEG